MSTVRRRLIRPPRPQSHPDHQAHNQKLHQKLEQDRLALGKWMSRLKRAFHAIEKIQRRVTRLERQLNPKE